MKTTPLHLAAGVLALWCGAAVLAQGALRDPTRPAWSTVNTPSTSQPPASRSSAQARAPNKPLPSDLRVQVLVLHQEQALAVVDGGVVQLGDAVHDWRVVEVSERGLALRHQSQIRQVSLTPAVIKTVQPPPLEAPQ